ncbi:MAG TPA: TlpA family protein disulfide reductase [Legionella sp.]|nr:TlpA family protein disulfide reductase [Legionella sp.]
MRTLALLFTLTILFCSTTTQAETLLQDIKGNDIPLSSLKGKWVFINYWAGWCQPCLDEIPILNQFYNDNKTKNVAMFAVNYDALPATRQEQLIKKLNIQYPSLNHNTSTLLHLGDISVVPITVVLNPNGEFSTTLYGGQTLDNLQEIITPPHPQA